MYYVPSEPEPEQNPQQPSEISIEAASGHAEEMLREGLTPRQVEQELVQWGLDPASAAAVVKNLHVSRSRRSRRTRQIGAQAQLARRQARSLANAEAAALKAAGQRNMLLGGLWCGGGLLVTIATFAAAAGGGVYLIAWGAILFGAIQFFRGLSQASAR
jgi:hypothetical protein